MPSAMPGSVEGELARRAQVAHGDAWQAQASLRAAQGGEAGELPGVRLMSSGLPCGKWNGADVTDATAVEMEDVRAWYRRRGVDQWGVRVPVGTSWPWGRRLLTLRLMVLELVEGARSGAAAGPGSRGDAAAVGPGAGRAGGGPGGTGGWCAIRRAGGTTTGAGTDDDLGAVVAVDATAFGAPAEEERAWLAPLVAAPQDRAAVAVAEIGGAVVGTGYCLMSRSWAGTAVYLGGVAVVPGARRRGVGAAVSRWLLEYGRNRGATIAHLHADTEGAARVYDRLGFVEVPGLDVYVDC